MSTSALLSALRVGGRQKMTASTFGARAQATGSHVFRIHRFTHVREKVANGTAVQSGTFGVGGHDWRVNCYPNGNGEQNQGCISLYLRHASHAKSGDATVKYKMSILNQAWKPSGTLSDEHRFTGNGWGFHQFMKLEDLDKEKHLEDDCLSVLCDVTVDLGLSTEDYTDEDAAAEELTKAPPPFPVHGIAEAIWNRQEPDVKIEVGDGQTLAAHRWVLEAGSPVFKADLAPISNDTVAELRVGDMDADVCKALLRFMYTNSPPPEIESMAERLLVAADRYELEELKLACEEALCKNIDTSSVTATLALAERHGCTVLREAGMRFLSSPGNLHIGTTCKRLQASIVHPPVGIMSTSALLSALRVGGRQKMTASTFGARAQATGSHVFRIHRFTHVREKVANGTAVQSGTFGVGGHDWRVNCYPNGNGEQNQGCISLYLRHASHAKSGDATVKYKMSILNQAWKPSGTLSDEHRFTGNGWGFHQFMKLEDLDKEKHLEDDCLSVLCDVTVDLGLSTEDYTDEDAAAEELTKAPPPFPVHGIAEAIWNRQEPDVKIEVGDGQTLAAHRWVLEAGSPVFKADLAPISNDTVAELRVGDMDADVCKALLRFMYTNSPPPEIESMAERLLVAADRYELEELKLACEEALCKNIDTSSVTATLALAERHGCTVLREAGMRFLSSPGNLHIGTTCKRLQASIVHPPVGIMSTSALLSALRVGGRQKMTASTFGARAQATGSHVFRIHRFTHVREKVANGTAVQSGTFGVGGHDWRVNCYPNGNGEQNQGCISLYLRHASHAKSGDATVKYKMSILNQAWKPSGTLSDEHRFTGNGWGFHQFMKLEDLDKEKHLEDDCLSVLCDVTVDLGLSTEDYTDEDAAAEELTKAPPPFPVHGIAEAIWNRQEPDVKIEVGDGQTLAAHRWVLEAGSPVFKADLAPISNDTVAELRVGDMDADVCKALLRFMYTNSPPPEIESMAERLLVAADRYELEELKLSCEEALCKNIDTSSVTATLALAERHGCTVLREAGMRFLSSPGNLDVVLASSDGLEKLKTGCPSALLEILEKKRPLNEQLISTCV